jgi:hypothetical protein
LKLRAVITDFTKEILRQHMTYTEASGDAVKANMIDFLQAVALFDV